MNSQNLIIYNLKPLFNILEEINLELNFKITFIKETNSLKNKIKETTDYLILSNKKYSDINNQFVIEQSIKYIKKYILIMLFKTL